MYTFLLQHFAWVLPTLDCQIFRILWAINYGTYKIQTELSINFQILKYCMPISASLTYAYPVRMFLLTTITIPLVIHEYKLGCVVRMVVYSIQYRLYFPIRKAGEMTIGKTQPCLSSLCCVCILFQNRTFVLKYFSCRCISSHGTILVYFLAI